MSKKDDGGGAFPFTPNQQERLADGTWDQDTEFGDPGMTLYDYYLAEMTKGLLTNPSMISPGQLKASRHHTNILELASELADAMIAKKRERESSQKE